jgi:multidrug efflux pump subunit AcrA (membrane-fusion protein)
MFVRARVDLGSPRDIVKLPSSAIAQRKGADAKIFAVTNGRAFVKQVELGRELDGAFIVEKGLRQGEIVIDAPSPLLKEGEDVETEG